MSASAGASRPARPTKWRSRKRSTPTRACTASSATRLNSRRRNGLTKVCMADKSNAMQHGHALWQRVFKEVAAAYPGITADPSIHRCARDVPRQGSRAVSGHRHQQPVRRHRHRHRRRAAGRARHGRLGQHPPRPDVAVRAGARLGAAAGGEECREPDRRDSVGGADARNARRASTNPRRSSARSKPRSPPTRPPPISAARSARARSATGFRGTSRNSVNGS